MRTQVTVTYFRNVSHPPICIGFETTNRTIFVSGKTPSLLVGLFHSQNNQSKDKEDKEDKGTRENFSSIIDLLNQLISRSFDPY